MTRSSLLTQRFLARCSVTVDALCGRAVEATLEGALARARETYPAFTVDDEAFIDHLAERLPAADDILSALEAVQLDDLFFAFAVAQGDANAQRQFVESFGVVVDRATRRFEKQGVLSDDVQQQLMEVLIFGTETRSPAVALYSGRGPLRAYVRVAAFHSALKLLERQKKLPISGGHEQLERIADTPDDPETMALKSRYGKQFKGAFQAVLTALDSGDRNLLRFHYMSGLNTRQIGKLLGVNQSTVVRRLAQLRGRLFDETRARLVEELGLAEDQLQSIVLLVQSQLDLSMSRVLANPLKPR